MAVAEVERPVVEVTDEWYCKQDYLELAEGLRKRGAVKWDDPVAMINRVMKSTEVSTK